MQQAAASNMRLRRRTGQSASYRSARTFRSRCGHGRAACFMRRRQASHGSERTAKPLTRTPGIRAAAAVDDKAAAAIFAGAPQTLAQIRATADRTGGRPERVCAQNQRARARREPHQPHHKSLTSSRCCPAATPPSPQNISSSPGISTILASVRKSPAIAKGTDRINNGAMDNAAGIATMLEVARVLSAEKTAPRRSSPLSRVHGRRKGPAGRGLLRPAPDRADQADRRQCRS